ncbi:hypothetical protein Tco_0884869, partial [Tanacetum coccineum]
RLNASNCGLEDDLDYVRNVEALGEFEPSCLCVYMSSVQDAEKTDDTQKDEAPEKVIVEDSQKQEEKDENAPAETQENPEKDDAPTNENFFSMLTKYGKMERLLRKISDLRLSARYISPLPNSSKETKQEKKGLYGNMKLLSEREWQGCSDRVGFYSLLIDVRKGSMLSVTHVYITYEEMRATAINTLSPQRTTMTVALWKHMITASTDVAGICYGCSSLRTIYDESVLIHTLPVKSVLLSPSQEHKRVEKMTHNQKRALLLGEKLRSSLLANNKMHRTLYTSAESIGRP